MEELKTQRFNDSFLDAIAAALPEIVADVERDGEYLRDDLRRARNPVSGEDVLDDMGG